MITSDFKKGMAIKYNGDTCLILSYDFVNPGKGTAFTRTKLKNAKSGKIFEVSFRSGESIEEASVEYRKSQYMYNDGVDMTFMDNATYDQFTLPLDNIGDMADFILDGKDLIVVYVDSQPFTIQLPPKMDLKVTDAPPGNKGDTATGGSKQVTLETGAKVNVPLFIKEGDVVRVNTDTREYVERVNQ
ncbi:elongation factor P [Candidatus Peregrinibacteria bacterium]|nr:elongation factor P [Candidatus Peregrinibacteria bacterium]